jgi:hypothetical protein
MIYSLQVGTWTIACILKEREDDVISFQQVNLPLPTPFNYGTHIFHVSYKMCPEFPFQKYGHPMNMA